MKYARQLFSLAVAGSLLSAGSSVAQQTTPEIDSLVAVECLCFEWRSR